MESTNQLFFNALGVICWAADLAPWQGRTYMGWHTEQTLSGNE